MHIIGRDAEKARLDMILRSKEAEFLALYGRRRVGKTFLIRQYLKAQIVFDISGTKEGKKHIQIANFFSEYLSRTNGQKETKTPQTWQQMFHYLAQYLYQLPPSESKYVVFLDEMPWMDTPKSDFISALEFFWNQHGSRMDHLLLVACGSASSWIRKHLINARGGLYNRITQRIKLAPFNLAETSTFLQAKGLNLPNYQVLELYMTFGGIPFYLKEVQPGKSVTQIIDDVCFSPNGLLTNEYDQLYYALFRDAQQHVRIVEALASKPYGLTRSELAHISETSEGQLSKVLEELTECDFITAFQPLFNQKKDTIYKLTDYYSLFYLKFIRPNKGQVKKVWEQLSYTTWSGYAFENICMQHLDQIKAALSIGGVYTKHGSWRYKGNQSIPGAQIDLIIDRADQVIHLCEAKFSREAYAVTKEFAEKLRTRAAIFRQATQTKKAVFHLLITPYPVCPNPHFLAEISHQVNMDQLFQP
jgi:uncharacterized protein